MTNRGFFLGLAAAVQHVYGMKMDWFDFSDLYVEDGKKTYATRRGYALGWMNEAITIVIIRWIYEFLVDRKLEKLVDFIVFNDDVEFGFKFLLTDTEMEVFKLDLVEFFKNKDVPCSIKKIFFSHQSIFLEDYYDPVEESEYSFEKLSVATRLYAKARYVSLPYLKKSYVNVASQIWHNDTLIKDIITHSPLEFKESRYNEVDRPFAAGGWFTPRANGLDSSMIDNPSSILLSIYLNEVKPNIEAPPPDGYLDFNKSLHKQYEKMVDAQKDYFQNAVDPEEVNANFGFDIGATLAHYVSQLPEDSIFKSYLGYAATEAVEPVAEGIG
jgi:hypothetical protein